MTGTVVAEQDVWTEVCDIQIHIAVAVVVAGRYPHAVAAMVRPAPCGDIFERAVPAVSKKPVRRSPFGSVIDGTCLNQIGVKVAIPVHIKHSHPTGGDFGK